MVSKKIRDNKENLIDLFNSSTDFVAYEFESIFNINMMICYIEGLIDRDILDRDILRSLIFNLKNPKDVKKIIMTSKVTEIHNILDTVDEIVYGKAILFVEGLKKCYAIELSKWDKRAVEQPQAESVIRGPKEGFIEDIAVNKVLIRRILRNNNLVYEDMRIGKQTKTLVSIAYLKGIVNEYILDDLKERLSKINIDSILESGFIEELIEDSPKTIFSTMTITEKPDIVAAKLLEGRVAIITDGTPHVLVVPRLFVEGLMSSEDYYLRPFYSSFLRALRAVSFLITIYLPGIYVALQLYHQEMIPTVLLVSAATSREGVPLPITVETIFLIIALELTKESGLRLPKSIGSTVTIFGALVLGQAAVQASLVSAPTIILVSITALAEFIIPQITEGIVIYRLILTLLGGFFGIYGVVCGFLIITMQIVSLESFGIPFSWTLSPINKTALKDGTIRVNERKFIYRPTAIARRNVKRQEPPKGE